MYLYDFVPSSGTVNTHTNTNTNTSSHKATGTCRTRYADRQVTEEGGC